MKRKVKICPNLQCEDRINKSDAAVCVKCGSSFRGMSWQFLDDSEIEKILNPQPEDAAEEIPQEESMQKPQTMQVIICPSCGKHIPYQVGLEFCECGEYVQEEVPVSEVISESGACTGADSQEQQCQAPKVSALRTLDGQYRLVLKGDFVKVGRHSAGKEYFESMGKFKVSREHAILQLCGGEWHLSYCKKEDRNYTNGVENPIYINGRKMDIDESYQLQCGDEIAFAELVSTNDPLAAFFRAE